MRVTNNLSLCKLINRINLHLLIFGDATVEAGWHGNVVSPLFSRLYYITKGSFSIIGKDGTKYILTAGKWYLVPSGFSFDYECNETMDHYYFHLKVCDLDDTDLLNKFTKPINIEAENFDKNLFDSCITDSNFQNGIKLRNSLWEILVSLINKGNINIITEDYSACIKNSIIFIKNNLSMQLTVSQIAENSFVSKSTLTKHFKKELSASITEYIGNMVLSKAERLLLTSNISILELSNKLGFSDQFYFSKKFKEKFGVSPREYRKNKLL